MHIWQHYVQNSVAFSAHSSLASLNAFSETTPDMAPRNHLSLDDEWWLLHVQPYISPPQRVTVHGLPLARGAWWAHKLQSYHSSHNIVTLTNSHSHHSNHITISHMRFTGFVNSYLGLRDRACNSLSLQNSYVSVTLFLQCYCCITNKFHIAYHNYFSFWILVIVN